MKTENRVSGEGGTAMKKALLGMLVLCYWCGMSHADPFNKEPKDHWPTQWVFYGTAFTNEWVTDPPYQRNIRFTFDNSADILAPIYQGTDDQVLQKSDFVDPKGPIEWFADDSFLGGQANRYGLMGIDNRQGTDNVSARITFHIDNWDHPREWKHMWTELIYRHSSDDTLVIHSTDYMDNHASASQPTGSPPIVEALGNNYLAWNRPQKIYPNPPWEEVSIILEVPPGQYAIIDEVHFATECVPEPATMGLVALAIAAVGVCRRRIQRRR